MMKDLFLAAESGDVQRIQNLYGEDSHVLDYVTFQGDTPLHIAARKGHPHLVRWILDRKPSLAGARNKDGNTPLHEAAKSGNLVLFEFLHEHKRSKAYRYNEFGETALMIASEYGHVEIVKLLLKASPNDNLVERERLDRDLEAVYRLFIKKIEWEVSVRQAAYRGYRATVEAMLDHPIKPITISLYDSMRANIKFKSDINARANRAKRIRAQYRDTLSVSETLGWGITGIPSQIIPETPILHTAVQGGHLEIIEAMLNHPSWENSSMEKMDEYGRCAVHVAAMKGHWNIISQFMVTMPDSMAIRSVDHKSVLHFAVEYNQLEVVQNLLINKDAESVTELVSRDHDCFGNTALHLAVINEVNPQLLKYLVSFRGVDLNALNDEGMSALDIASAAAKHNPHCAIIVEILETAGGIRSSLIPKSNTTSGPSNDSKQGRDKDIVDVHMVVASLIATVTFAAIFQIPGGIEEDDKQSIHYEAAKMAFRKVFRLFLFSDTVAFTTSLTVVVAWLVRQQLPDTYFGGPPVLSHLSGVTLPFSIFWTAVAFVSATIIVILPRNYEELKSNDKEAYLKYGRLWRGEIAFAFIPPFYAVYMLLVPIILRMRGNSFRRSLFVGGVSIQLCSVTIFILWFSLT